MAFTPDNFRANMSGGGARPNLFDIILTAPSWVGFPTSDFVLKAKATSIPASTVGVKTLAYFGHDVQFAGDRTYEDWNVSIYNDEDFAVRDAFERWMDGIARHSQDGSIRGRGATANPHSYIGSAIVRQYGKSGGIIKEYELINVWPTNLASISIDWDTKDDIEMFDVTLKTDKWGARTTT